MARDGTSPLGITLNQVLNLTGRLDDSPGFDSPRERFRRFLVERVTDVAAARALLDEGQRSPGEQHHRAVQDVAVLLGRFLGFETTFGTYEALAGGVKYDGQWRTRRRLQVVLEIRTDQTPHGDLGTLSRSLTALAALSHLEAETRRIGLSVVTPLYVGRGRLEDWLLTADRHGHDLRIVSLHSVLALGEFVGTGLLKHDDVLKLLTSGHSIDFVVDLLTRNQAGAAPGTTGAQRHATAAPAVVTEDYWLAAIDDEATTVAEQFVQSVIGRRQILPLGTAPDDGPRPGDWMCFFIPRRGVAGYAQAAAIDRQGANLVRDGARFARVVRLQNVTLYRAPIPVLQDMAQSQVEGSPAQRPGPYLVAISRQGFLDLTTPARADADETTR